MHTTSETLLERLRRPGDQDAWRRFVHLYTPLLYHWARRLGVPQQDLTDLIQEVFAALVQKLPAFTYDRTQTFRGWLWTVTRNKWHDLRRRARACRQAEDDELAELEKPDDALAFDEAEYRQHLVRQALQLVQVEFQPTTWKACWEYLIAGRPAEEVARELNLSVNAVYVAKSRVLSRLRQELAGLLD